MKLHNKKTGVITEAYLIIDEPGIRRYADSIKDLCEEYEDYTPAEPLIKDEKIRKAVRAWAELNNIKEVTYIITGGGLSVFTKNGVEIDFTFQVQGVQDGKHYTIAELCGEEEE